MSPERKKMPALSSAPAAERMRRYRKRRRRGIRCVRVQIHVTEIDALIRKKYLDQQSRDDLKAVEYAIRTVVLDALTNEAWRVTAGRPRVAKKLKLQERRAVIPSRRSLAACRPLGFLGRLRAPSRIGGHTRGTYGVGTYPGLHHWDGGP